MSTSKRLINSKARDPRREEGESVELKTNQGDHSGGGSHTVENGFNLDIIDESDTDSEVEFEKKVEYKSWNWQNEECNRSRDGHEGNERDENEKTGVDNGKDGDEDIPISDLEDMGDARDDLIPYTRLTIYNAAALTTSLKRIMIPIGLPASFVSHQCVTSEENPTEESVTDVSDDLDREIALYAQSLGAVKLARIRLRAEGAPFTRPNDYFAEMVKEDAHMDKVRHRLVEEASAKKAAVEARKLRDLKKFGKQVQVAKLQERHKTKRETLDKIKELKRSKASSFNSLHISNANMDVSERQDNSNNQSTREVDMFDVGIENELTGQRTKRSVSGGRKGGDGPPNPKRRRKDEKYGFGGKKRFGKSGDTISSGDLSNFNGRRSKGMFKMGSRAASGNTNHNKTTRLGKARRHATKF